MKRSKWASLAIIIAAALLLQMISAVQYYYTRGLLADELEKRAESEITTKAVIVKNALNMAENTLSGHVWDMKRNLAWPDSMYGVAEWVLRSHPNLIGCGIAFVPDYYPEKGRLFLPYVYRKPPPESGLGRMQAAGASHDYTTMPYYKAAINRDATFWSDPYYNSQTNDQIVTFCRPIHDAQHHIVAVFGLDIDVNWLGDTLNYRHIYPSSYNFLLTESGQLIAGPRHSQKQREKMMNIIRLINDSTMEKSGSKSGHTSVFPVTDADGDRGLVFYATFKGNPKWKIAVVCYDKEVYGKLSKMRISVGLLLLVALLVLALMVFRFAKNTNKLYQANMERERIGSELRIARDIQQQMLPRSFSLGCGDLDIFGSLTPARGVGGDLFDFFLRDEKLFFCIGDVSGKGVPAAIVMACVHTMFRMAAAHEDNPARIMLTINETSCEGNDANIFVTLFIGVLDLPTGRLRYCNAGHDRPIVIRSPLSPLPLGGAGGGSQAVGSLPVGLFADYKYTMEETTLDRHSMLFLYTDGLTEAMNRERRQFGLERVQQVIGALNPQGSGVGISPRQLVELMGREVAQFCHGVEQSDDLTMLAIRYERVRREMVLDEKLVLKNDVRQVKELSTFVRQVTERLGLEQKTAKQVRLAVEEAVVNVMNYAYPAGTSGDIGIEALSDGQWLKFAVTDTGVAFNPTEKEKADTTLSVEERPVGGMGILLVRELMDSINYERIGGKNVLSLKKEIRN